MADAKLIQKLARDAGFDQSHQADPNGLYVTWGVANVAGVTRELWKFAALVAEEAAKTVERIPRNANVRDLEAAATEIRRKFIAKDIHIMNFDKVDAYGRMKLDTENGPFSAIIQVREGTSEEELQLIGGNTITSTFVTVHGLTKQQVADLNDRDFVHRIELSRKLRPA